MGIYYSEPKYYINDFAFRIYTKKYVSDSYLYSIEIENLYDYKYKIKRLITNDIIYYNIEKILFCLEYMLQQNEPYIDSYLINIGNLNLIEIKNINSSNIEKKKYYLKKCNLNKII